MRLAIPRAKTFTADNTGGNSDKRNSHDTANSTVFIFKRLSCILIAKYHL